MKRWRCIIAAAAGVWLAACASAPATRNAAPNAADLRAIDTLQQSELFGVELLDAARLDAKHTELRRYGAVLSRDYGRRRQRIRRWRDANFTGTATSIKFDPPCSATQYARAETAIGGDMAILNQLIAHRDCLSSMATGAAQRTGDGSTKALLNALAENYSSELEILRRWRDAWGR